MEPSAHSLNWQRIMLRIVLIFIPLLAVAALTGYVTGMRSFEKAQVEAQQPAESGDDRRQAETTGSNREPVGTSQSDTEPDEPQRQAEVPYPPRNVTPPGVHTGPIRSYEPASAPEPESQSEPATRTFHRVVVEAAGLLQAAERQIRLAGITAPALEETCTDAGDREWPCGMAARTALRQLVRNRAVECDIVDDTGDELIGNCQVGSRQLSAWLVEQGWAEPEDDRYRDAAAAARDEERGMFATAADGPGPVALPVSDDSAEASPVTAE